MEPCMLSGIQLLQNTFFFFLRKCIYSDLPYRCSVQFSPGCIHDDTWRQPTASFKVLLRLRCVTTHSKGSTVSPLLHTWSLGNPWLGGERVCRPTHPKSMHGKFYSLKSTLRCSNNILTLGWWLFCFWLCSVNLTCSKSDNNARRMQS